MDERHGCSLSEVAGQLKRADLLLFRGNRFFSKLIKAAGRSEYSHAAKIDIIGGVPYCVEIREWIGGRMVTLESQILKYPGRIDVFRVNPRNFREYSAQAAVTHMRQFAGKSYGWYSVFRAAIQHLPIIRLIWPPDFSAENGDGFKSPLFCSQACAIADRLAGHDPVPHLADKFTLPGDLARSEFYEYKFTLTGV